MNIRHIHSMCFLLLGVFAISDDGYSNSSYGALTFRTGPIEIGMESWLIQKQLVMHSTKARKNRKKLGCIQTCKQLQIQLVNMWFNEGFPLMPRNRTQAHVCCVMDPEQVPKVGVWAEVWGETLSAWWVPRFFAQFRSREDFSSTLGCWSSVFLPSGNMAWTIPELNGGFVRVSSPPCSSERIFQPAMLDYHRVNPNWHTLW